LWTSYEIYKYTENAQNAAFHNVKFGGVYVCVCVCVCVCGRGAWGSY